MQCRYYSVKNLLQKVMVINRISRRMCFWHATIACNLKGCCRYVPSSSSNLNYRKSYGLNILPDSNDSQKHWLENKIDFPNMRNEYVAFIVIENVIRLLDTLREIYVKMMI